MAKFVPRGKMGKKARKELDRLRRATWEFSPVTKKVESGKIYSRKRKARNRDDCGPGFLFAVFAYSRFRWILPEMVLGSSSRKTILRGYLYGAVCCLT